MTGPSFTGETRIDARNRPVATVAPRSRNLETTPSTKVVGLGLVGPGGRSVVVGDAEDHTQALSDAADPGVRAILDDVNRRLDHSLHQRPHALIVAHRDRE